MRALVLRLLLLAAPAWLVAGCPDKIETQVDGGAVAAVEPIDAGPPQPVPLEVRVAFDVPDAGLQHVVLEPGQRATVPQASRIELDTNQPVRNYRIRLFDETDKAVPSTDSADDGPDRVHYVVNLEAPLRTGYRYALVLDAQTGATMLDGHGRPISDLRYELQVAGERQKPPPPPKKKASKKRRK